MKNIIILTICFVIITLTGCMTMPKVDMSALRSPGPVTTVIAAWGPAVSNGENPERGFGGRVYFYDAEQNRPVKVKGTVVVYAFDEDGRDKWDAKPNEGFVFSSKTLNSKEVYSKTTLGHSYRLWIPIDDATRQDNPARKISLIVRYIPEKGSSVVSAQTTTQLPGRGDQEQFIADVELSEWDSPIQEAIRRSAPPRSVPERARLSEERVLESNIERSRTMESATIR